MIFLLRATEAGLIVARPFATAISYDFIVECNGICHRVQVKSSILMPRSHKNFPRWKFTIGKGSATKSAYDKRDCEFIALITSDNERVYIVPIDHLKGRITLSIYPDRPNELDQYRDAWHLLRV